MGQPVGPIGEFFVGAAPAIADQGGVVAMPFVDHRIGQFETRIQDDQGSQTHPTGKSGI